ncbi:hypothetical protein S83_015443, partial [Arachis hypogaea]
EVEHLKNIAVWASHEAQIPSLGAFYVQHLAAAAEADGIMLGDFVLHLGYFSYCHEMGSGRIFTLLAIEASSPLSIDLTTTSGCETNYHLFAIAF